MSEPNLYQVYSREEAIAFFGSGSSARSLCDGEWVIFPDTVVCMAAVGDPPKRSFFGSGSQFYWVAERPYRVSEDKYTYFVPEEAVGLRAKVRTRHLFVQPQGSSSYVYLGQLGASYMQQAPSAVNHGMARFELKPTLPSDVWKELAGFDPGALNHEPVDRALDGLRGRTDVAYRLGILKTLVEYWHGPIRAEDGLRGEELCSSTPIPHPLGWWYEWAGRRREIMSGQNILLVPRDPAHPYCQLKEEDGRLLYYLENQAVYRWATMAEGEDPLVFGRWEMNDPWEEEGIKLSEHLIGACILEAVTCHSKYGAAAACLDGSTLSNITQVVTPVSIDPWKWNQTRFYVGNGAFMYSMENGEDVYSVWIGAKTEKPLQFLKPYLDDAWEYVAV